PSWPSDVVDEPEFLHEIGITDFEVATSEQSVSISGNIQWFSEIVFPIPAVDSVSLVLLSGDGAVEVPFELDVYPSPALRLPSLNFTLRITSDLLHPVHQDGGKWVRLLDSEGNPQPLELRLSGVGVGVDFAGGFEIISHAGAPSIGLGAV